MSELCNTPDTLDVIGGRYRVECSFASGPESTVVGAVDCATGKRVVLKCWSGPTSEQEVAAVQRFVRAANLAGLFDNPHVVEVYATELGDSYSYTVTEWLEGSTLARHLTRLGRLASRDALQHLLPCMQAVVEAHAAGVVHGDIRPAHVFLARATKHRPERARVFDFGRGMPGFGELRLPTRAVVDEFCRYAPPELLQGAPIDARSDIYAFGLLLHEALTGQPVFPQDDLRDLLRAIEAGELFPYEQPYVDVPRGLVEVLKQAVAVDPDRRYPDLASFVDALRPFASMSALPTSPASVWLAHDSGEPERTRSQAPHGVRGWQGSQVAYDPRPAWQSWDELAEVPGVPRRGRKVLPALALSCVVAAAGYLFQRDVDAADDEVVPRELVTRGSASPADYEMQMQALRAAAPRDLAVRPAEPTAEVGEPAVDPSPQVARAKRDPARASGMDKPEVQHAKRRSGESKTVPEPSVAERERPAQRDTAPAAEPSAEQPAADQQPTHTYGTPLDRMQLQ